VIGKDNRDLTRAWVLPEKKHDQVTIPRAFLPKRCALFLIYRSNICSLRTKRSAYSARQRAPRSGVSRGREGERKRTKGKEGASLSLSLSLSLSSAAVLAGKLHAATTISARRDPAEEPAAARATIFDPRRDKGSVGAVAGP